MFFLISTVLAININAQKNTQNIIVSNTVEVKYEDKFRPALSYEIDVDFETLKKNWKDFLKDRYKASCEKEEDTFLVTEDVVIGSISKNRINLYANIVENQRKSRVSFLGAFGYDIYIDSQVYSKEFKGLKMLAETFLLESSMMFYTDKIAELSEGISDLKEENTNLTKDNIEMNNEIKEGENTIVTLNDEKTNDSSKNIKIMKKIKKIMKNNIDYEEGIRKNKKDVKNNNYDVELLKKKIEFYEHKIKLLGNVN